MKVTVTVSSNQIIGASKTILNDHEGITMTMLVDQKMFPTVSTYIREGNPEIKYMLICVGLALVYWLIFLRTKPIAHIRSDFAEKFGVPIAIIDKRRPKANVMEVMNIIGDVSGKRCLMIDDMIDTAGTICQGAQALKDAGATVLRGGAFKPRTSPYSFQGRAYEGLDMLCHAREQTGLPIVTEIMGVEHLPLFEDVDIIQVGARNMQNFDLLRELGKLRKPILLKRGLASTLKELLMSAEYIMAGGNEQVILCERGIRTFDDYTRNTLDLAAVPMLKELTHLPVIVDPSHATGIARLVRPMALAAAACGSDGLIIEVHNDPIHALCDGAQSLRPEQYDDLAKAVRRVRKAVAE